MTTDPFLSSLVAAYEDSALPMPVEEWVAERCANALQIASTKAGKDRDGWIEDARYFRIILERLKGDVRP
jgi:hypothetical protein